ncbi:MAG: hypothetical protein ACK4WH_12675 [Phycisphaerales bacterium]
MTAEPTLERPESPSWTDTPTVEDLLARRTDRRATRTGVPSPRRLIERSVLLAPDDKALIRAIYAEGLPLRVVAELRGQSPRACRESLARLVRRLCSPAFQLAADPRGLLTRRQAAVARACFIEGLTMRQAAARLRTSLHIVRSERARMLAMVEGLTLAERLRRPDRTPALAAA